LPRPFASRRARIFGAFVLAFACLCYLVSSLSRIAAGETGILDYRFPNREPRILPPGWILAPLGFSRLTRYPRGSVEIPFSIPDPAVPRLSSSEGVSVQVRGALGYRIPADAVLTAHRRSGGRLKEQILLPLLDKTVTEAVRETSFTRISGAHRIELEAALSRRLGPQLRGLGLTFLNVRVDSVLIAPGGNRVEAPRPIPEARLLLVGLDGADWRIIDPLLAAGKLPNLARLIEEGVRSPLESVEPILSPVVWTTAATGFLPSEHGILDFLAEDRRTGERIPVTSRNRKVKAIWNLLSDSGVRVGVIGWWATWPAEFVDGYIVSDRVAYQLFRQAVNAELSPAGKTFPPELFSMVAPLIVPPDRISDVDLAPFMNPESLPGAPGTGRFSRRDEFRTILASTRTYENIAGALGTNGYQPFEAIYFEGIDTTSHLFMPFRPPRRPGISEEDFRRFSGVVNSFYRYQDEILGRILSRAGPGTSVIVLSDHGFKSENDRPFRESRVQYATAAQWHRRHGILVAAGPVFRKGTTLPRASIVDITPTILAFFGLPTGEDMQGRPIREIFTEDFLRAHPIAFRPSWESSRPAPSVAVSDPAGDQAMKEKLLSLGYLSQEGTLPHNNRGSSLLAQGRVEEAIREFEAAVKAEPRFPLSRINLARAYLAAGDAGRARSAAEAALRLDRESPDALLFVANLDRLQGHDSRAEDSLRAVLAKDPSRAEAHRSLGLLYQSRGRAEDALREYRLAIRIDPEDVESTNNIGVLLKEAGQPEEAEIQFREALKADPDYAGAYNNLALLAMDRSEWGEAHRLLEEARKRTPEDPFVYNNLGNLSLHEGKLPEAEAFFQKALGLRPAYAEPHNGLGAVHAEKKQWSEADSEYREALRIRPDYSEARLNLARALAEQGRGSEAESELRRLLARSPSDSSAAFMLGNLLLERGRSEETVELCRRSVSGHPSSAPLYELLGRALLAAGRTAEAREAFSRSLALQPDQPGIGRQLRILEGSP
jgi:tetratricopeptide (TPR) repeat protein